MPTWGLRILFTAGGIFAAFLLFAVIVQVPAVARTMGSPQACGTCHFMEPQIDAFHRSAHRELACLDCHTAKGFFAKPIEEIKSASLHVWVTMTRSEPDVVHLREESRELMQANCQSCHSAIFSSVLHNVNLEEKNCTDCHRGVPHDRPNVISNGKGVVNQ